MTNKSVWFITGAGRGMEMDIAGAALAAGNAVVAQGSREIVIPGAQTPKFLADNADAGEVEPGAAEGGRY